MTPSTYPWRSFANLIKYQQRLRDYRTSTASPEGLFDYSMQPGDEPWPALGTLERQLFLDAVIDDAADGLPIIDPSVSDAVDAALEVGDFVVVREVVRDAVRRELGVHLLAGGS